MHPRHEPPRFIAKPQRCARILYSNLPARNFAGTSSKIDWYHARLAGILSLTYSYATKSQSAPLKPKLQEYDFI